jgi:hypothetical protein
MGILEHGSISLSIDPRSSTNALRLTGGSLNMTGKSNLGRSM